MKKVERVELVLENCEIFEIRAEDIGFIDIKMDKGNFTVANDEVISTPTQATSVFFEVAKIYGTFVFEDDFVEGADYVVKSERLSYMDIVYLDFHYDDGSSSRVDVPFNTHLVPEESWQMTNELEHVLVTSDAIYVMIGEGKLEERVSIKVLNSAKKRIENVRIAVTDRKNSEVEKRKNATFEEHLIRALEMTPVYIHPVSEEQITERNQKYMEGLIEKMEKEKDLHEKYLNSDRANLVWDVLAKVRAIPVEDIKVGGRVAYVNRQGDVVAEYVTDISGEFVGLRSGNVIHYTKVTALVAG